MAFAPTSTATAGSDTGQGENAPADLRLFVFALFFIFGGITSLNDVLIPKLKELFTLGYAEAFLVQSAFFAAYFIVSIPAAALVTRLGYMRTAAIGLVTMTAGCLLFLPAASSGLFATFLGALFVLAAGITIVQVVANPLISMLGRPATASSRLTFAQAFNSLGTTVFPFVGAKLILGSLAGVSAASLTGEALRQYREAESAVISNTYLGLAVALTLVAALVWARRRRLVEAPVEPFRLSRALELFARPRFAWGALGIFLYVGAEVAIGSLLVNYLILPDKMGVSAMTAGELVAFYWGGAMVGRFIGAELLRRFDPPRVLFAACLGAITLIIVSAALTGAISGWALLAVGLANAIMFPTIFTLACAGLGARAAEGSGLICMAIVGGAIVPPLTGVVADATSLGVSLAVPALCYVGIAAYAAFCQRRPVTDAA